jgi:endonuclease/exonuclease/phosphatase family metal-dependent hydrolase
MSYLQSPPPELRVLTYNIFGASGKVDLQRIAEVIQSQKPHLVALQEVDDRTRRSGAVNQITRLGGLTGMHSYFARAMDYDGGGYGDAVLSVYPFEKVIRHALPADADCEPRSVAEVHIHINPGHEIYFLATHLDHTDEDQQRINQAKKINQLFSGDLNRTMILAGDMNALPGSRPLQEFSKYWTNTMSDDASPTWPADQPYMRLDYIFYKPVEALRVIESTVIKELTASDHRPVLTVFALA